MRKYVIYFDPGQMSPNHVKKHMVEILTDLKERRIIGQHDPSCVVTSSGPTRIEALPMSIFEKLPIYIEVFLGKVRKF